MERFGFKCNKCGQKFEADAVLRGGAGGVGESAERGGAIAARDADLAADGRGEPLPGERVDGRGR